MWYWWPLLLWRAPHRLWVWLSWGGIRFHLTLSIAQEPPSQSRSVSYCPSCCMYSQGPLKLEYLITWLSKYTSGQPQVSCLKMPMFLCVEPRKLPGSFVPYKHPSKQNGVGVEPFFFLSILYPSTADWYSLPKMGPLLWELFKPIASPILKGHMASKSAFPHRWKEFLNSQLS